MVYIKEAHPEGDGDAALIHNVKAGIHIEEATTDLDRAITAKKMCSTLHTSLPCVVDSVDNHVNDVYAAWPARIYLLSADGKVFYRSGPGPEGFKPAEARDALERLLGVVTQVSSAAAR